MLSLLRVLFDRYAAEHLSLERPGGPIYDDRGRPCGFVDTIALRHNRIEVAGWADGDLVRLSLGGMQTEMAPSQPRSDVRAQHPDLRTPDPGFRLALPQAAGPAIVSLARGGERLVTPFDTFAPRRIRRARRALLPAYALALLRGLPAWLRFRRTGDPAARLALKRALGLEDRSDVAAMAPGLFAPAPAPDPVAQALARTRVTIVLPVFNAFDLLPEVLDRLRRHTDLPWHLVVVEDCSSDPAVRPWLRDWVAGVLAAEPGRVTLIENPQNLGFIRSVNAALAVAADRGDHVILLNSDAFVPQGWASRLIRPILAHDNVATVTPMSNDAEIFTVPVICRKSALRPGEADRLDALARRFHPDADLAVAPTGVGFCMAMNIAYLKDLPELDTGFGRGYGEEVDWCQRARALGGRHLGLPGLFVEHRGGTSFGSAEKLKLVARNNAVISARYPRYDGQVQDFIRHDPLATPRLALGIGWLAGRADGPVSIYLAHGMGGGAEDYLARRIADEIAAGAPGALVLRVGRERRWQLELHCDLGISRGLTESWDFVLALLAPLGARRIVYSCGVGDRDPIELPDRLLELKRDDRDAIEVLIHDFLPLSPSYTLLDADGCHRGAPDPARPDAAHMARRPDGRRASLADWQAAWGRLMAAADRVTVFSASSRDLVAAVYPQAAGALHLCPHRLLVEVPACPAPAPDAPAVIGVLGNIGYQKGAAVLRDLSQHLARTRAAGLVVLGKIDPAYALTPPAAVLGGYRREDIADLARRHGITAWLIPSIWPETFSYATHEAIATGLPVWCFDLGAQAEAVRASLARGGLGGVLPLTADGPVIADLAQALTKPLEAAGAAPQERQTTA